MNPASSGGYSRPVPEPSRTAASSKARPHSPCAGVPDNFPLFDLVPLSLGAGILDRRPLIMERPEADVPRGKAPRPAAVLVPIVMRDGQAQVLLTRRTDHLADHGGQIAFPGGKIDSADATPLDTALREAREEIGLKPHQVTALGYLAPSVTATGFHIVPVVGALDAGFDPVPNPSEVAQAFEVPLAFLMNRANWREISGMWGGKRRASVAMPYKTHYIWGITARILMQLRTSIDHLASHKGERADGDAR